MIMFYFLHENMLLLLFCAGIVLIAVQTIYISLIKRNIQRKIQLVTEIFILGFAIVSTILPIFAREDRRYGTVLNIELAYVLYFFSILLIVGSLVQTVLYRKRAFVIVPVSLLCIFYTSYTTMFLPTYIFTQSLLLIRAIQATIKIRKKLSTEISAFSVQEGIDSLPAGLMFFESDGYILLTNSCMLQLMDRFCGKEQRNALLFWNTLKSMQLCTDKTQISTDSLIIRTEIDTWSFTQRTFTEHDTTYVELTAIDITEIDTMLLELQEDSKKLMAQRDEVHTLTDTIVALRTEQEYSRIRSQIHDVMGQRLTALQRLLQSQKDTELTHIVPLLHNLVENIREERKESAGEMLLELRLYFERVGINIKLVGCLPKDDSVAFLFLAVLREATTNAVRHAGASKVNAQIEKNKDNYTLTITNNGKKPQEDKKEGSGLSGIRKRVETMSGTVHIEWVPSFKIIVKTKGKKYD